MVSPLPSEQRPEPEKVEIEEQTSTDPLLLAYRELAAQNPDLVGWIQIEGTQLDSPVMHSPDEPQRYLHSDFEGRYSFSGLPFLEAECEANGLPGNKIVYGHNMRDGTRFAALKKYLKNDFFAAHPYIRFDTLNSRGTYKVMAVLQLREEARTQPAMLCYRQIDTTDETSVTEFNEYMKMRATWIADDAEVFYGDTILTLSTCERAGSDARIVVLARRVEE